MFVTTWWSCCRNFWMDLKSSKLKNHKNSYEIEKWLKMKTLEPDKDETRGA